VKGPLHAGQRHIYDGVVEHQHQLRGGYDEQRQAEPAFGTGRRASLNQWDRSVVGHFLDALTSLAHRSG
jgi:hypothetical protein